MGKKSAPWIFSAIDAAKAVTQVTNDDPSIERDRELYPADRDAADVAVIRLRETLSTLPAFARHAMRGAASGASQLSDDRLQGLAELLQNADDVAASEAVFLLDEVSSQLFFAHNGARLGLHDVLALSVPWLSQKGSEADQLGRYGIGLSTLQSLSKVLIVHGGNFHFRLESQTIENAGNDQPWIGDVPFADSTTFLIPLAQSPLNESDLHDWLSNWGDAGLIFLKHLRTIRLVNAHGDERTVLAVYRDAPVEVHSADRRSERMTISSRNGSWDVYSRLATSPDVDRANKAKAATTQISIAVPQFSSDHGFLHVGLPVRPIGLPFRVQAQFDPVTNRRDISATPWTLKLLELVAQLWLDAALDLFERAPEKAWAAIPLQSEIDADQLTTGAVRDALSTALLNTARLRLAATLELTSSDGDRLPLSELAYEASALNELLSEQDVKSVSTSAGVLPRAARSDDERWREVLSELRNLGAAIPKELEIRDCIPLLDTSRNPSLITDLLALVIENDLDYLLGDQRCLLVESGAWDTLDNSGPDSVLLPDDAGPLWATLAIGSRLNPEYSGNEGWPIVASWLEGQGRLLRDAPDEAALEFLRRAGELGESLPSALSDVQTIALRDALERVNPERQESLGRGIGKVIKLDAVTFDGSQRASQIFASPARAYLIENERASWRLAAGTVQGPVWLHRRYQGLLRSARGRDGLGSQRFLRMLGAESAPRLVSHPASERKYATSVRGLHIDVVNGTERRRRFLREMDAEWTLDDKASPDLDAVLASIALEPVAETRRRRIIATLATLSRAWTRLEQFATVEIAVGSYGWHSRGRSDAWWVHRAATTKWLEAEDGSLSAPADLRVRTSSTEALYGADESRYLAADIADQSSAEILRVLGVEDEAAIDELMTKLELIQSSADLSAPEMIDLAAPIYVAIAAQLRRPQSRHRRILPGKVIRSRFIARKLIATELGWLTPDLVLGGPPIFGTYRAFVPVPETAKALWDLLGVRLPNATVAEEVTVRLSNSKSPTVDDLEVMRKCLDILVSAPENLGIGRLPLWTGSGWTSKRPIFSVGNPLLAERLGDVIPMWLPGGSLERFEPIADQLGVVRLDFRAIRVVGGDDAMVADDLSSVFERAVNNLQSDLVINDPVAEATVRVPWNDLRETEVRLLNPITIDLPNPRGQDRLSVDVRAWLDVDSKVFYLCGAEIATQRDAGYAFATAFEGYPRAIALSWLAAWSDAERGVREDAPASAASRAKDDEQTRAAQLADGARWNADTARLKQFQIASREKRSASSLTVGTTSNVESEVSPAGGTTEKYYVADRRLVDPQNYGLAHTEGDILRAQPLVETSHPNAQRSLRAPSAAVGWASGAQVRQYSDRERESVGMELARKVLGMDTNELRDIRDQRGVGADAIDALQNYYELKVHSGPIPDQIRLQDSEIQRAYETENFFLIVVGNVELGGDPPVVRVITDPLHKLTRTISGHAVFSGVRAASAIEYSFKELAAEAE